MLQTEPVDSALNFAQPCARDPLSPTIFHEDWWLEAATGGRYTQLEVREDGKVAARMPLFPRAKGGILYSLMPVMTPFLGPALSHPKDAGPATKKRRHNELMDALLAQMPRLHVCRIKCSRALEDALPFQKAGFQTTVQFTHEIAPTSEDEAWVNMRGFNRNLIKSAAQHCTITHGDDPGSFLAFYESNLHGEGMKGKTDRARTLALIEQSLARGRGRIYETRDEKNRLRAAVFGIWDDEVFYYMISTRGPLAGKGDIRALVWEEMKDALRKGLVFDSGGVAGAWAVSFFADFCGQVRPRYLVTKTCGLGKVLLPLYDARRKDALYC